MSAVHELQDSVIEGLDSHTYPVDTQIKKSLDIRFPLIHYIFRIDLNSEFLIWSSVTSL